jgi:hypothetical protein
MTSTSSNDRYAEQKTAQRSSSAADAKTDKSKSASTSASDPQSAARELHGAGSELGGQTLPMLLGDDVWEQFVNAVRADDRYAIRDPNNPDSVGSTGSSGSNPPPPVILQYGDGARDYVAVTFDSGQVMVTDAADETGKTYKYPETQWRRFVARVRGEEIPDDLKTDEDRGPTQYEAAAEQNKRTFERLQAERERGESREADRR